MRKLILISMFLIALFIPATSAFALSSGGDRHGDRDRKYERDETRRDDNNDWDRDRNQNQTQDEDEVTTTTKPETTTTSVVQSENNENPNSVPPKSNDSDDTETSNTNDNECIQKANATWNDTGNNLMGIPEKELSFSTNCTPSNSSTTVLAYFFYGYTLKTIEHSISTTITNNNVINAAPVTSPTQVQGEQERRPQFPVYQNNGLQNTGAEEFAMGETEPENEGSSSNAFSIPVVVTSIGSILLYAIKRRLLIPFI